MALTRFLRRGQQHNTSTYYASASLPCRSLMLYRAMQLTTHCLFTPFEFLDCFKFLEHFHSQSSLICLSAFGIGILGSCFSYYCYLVFISHFHLLLCIVPNNLSDFVLIVTFVSTTGPLDFAAEAYYLVRRYVGTVSGC